MLVKKLSDARRYDAPNHFDVRSLRLQGFEPGGPTSCWIGLSYFLPGGGAGPDASPLEKTYVVLQGQITIRIGTQETRLGPLDSCTIAPNETREVLNESNEVVTMLVAMPYPPSQP